MCLEVLRNMEFVVDLTGRAASDPLAVAQFGAVVGGAGGGMGQRGGRGGCYLGSFFALPMPPGSESSLG